MAIPSSVPSIRRKSQSNADRFRALDRRWLFFFIATALIVFTLNALGAAAAHHMSAHDEQQHFDYAYRVGHFDIPGDNPLLTQETLRELSCRGIDFSTLRDLGGCVDRRAIAEGIVYDPANFPDGGYNTATGAPPTYYFLTGIIGRFLDFIGPWDALYAMRLANGLWLVLASLSVAWIARRYSASMVATGAAIAIFATTATVATVSNFVTSDAGVLGWAALTCCVADWALRRRSPAALSVLAGMLIVGITIDKAYLVAFVFVASLALVLLLDGLSREVRERSIPRAKWILLAVGAGTIGLLGIGIKVLLPELNRLRRSLTGGEGVVRVTLARDSFFTLPPFSMDLIYRPLAHAVPPLSSGYIPPGLGGPAAVALTTLVGFLLMSATLGSWLTEREATAFSSFRTAALMTLFLGPFALSLGLWLSGTYWEIISRFAISVLPPAFAVVAVVIRRRPAVIAVSILALTQVSNFVYENLHLISSRH